jgi:hypothetical protein
MRNVIPSDGVSKQLVLGIETSSVKPNPNTEQSALVSM